MPPIVKENETLSAKPETAVRSTLPAALPGAAAMKPQPVPLEVAVTVNGARPVEGSDKREPFSENTKTVLVFGNGGVIRLSSLVAPGQLLFVTNEKTKKEVVCQVVKSKNYRNVSGYVELEFTQPVVGFWGIRFPGDRLGPGSQPAAPVASPAASATPVALRSVVPGVELPRANVTPDVVRAKPAALTVVARDPEAKPAGAKFQAPSTPLTEVPAVERREAPVVENSVLPEVSTTPVAPASANPEFTLSAAPVKPVEPSSSGLDLPRASDVKPLVFVPPLEQTASSNPEELDARRLPRVSEVKPAVLTAMDPPQAPIASDPETAALKQQTARLQEQLSSLLFTDRAPTKLEQKAPVAPVIDSAKFGDSAARVLEIAKKEPAPVPVKPAEPATIVPAPLPSSLDGEEMKIPAWLEPLARNSAAPASTEELIEREKAKRIAEQAKIEKIATEPVAAVEEEAFEFQAPTFGSQLPVDEKKNRDESGSKSSRNVFLVVGIAAAVVLLAGGSWWYKQSQRNAAGQSNSPLQTNAPLQTNSAPQTYPAPNSVNAAPAGISAALAPNAQPTTNPANSGRAAVTPAFVQPAPEQPKKPVLGQVHLAKPKVTKRGKVLDGGDADAGIALNEGQPEWNGETLGAGLAMGNQQPRAPAEQLAVGGDVRQAKLISSVPPLYPNIAKSQHVAGDVRIDALIDTNGRVTTMKVVSGPTLLHQAAMDALRQWKYQPAMLDGKPVMMHLTVTLQFRLQ